MRKLFAQMLVCVLFAGLFTFALHTWGQQADAYALLDAHGELITDGVSLGDCWAIGEARYRDTGNSFECVRQ